MITTAAQILNVTKKEIQRRIAILAHTVSKHEKCGQSEAWKKAWSEFKKQIALRIEEREDIMKVEAIETTEYFTKGKTYIAIVFNFGLYTIVSDINGKTNPCFLIKKDCTPIGNEGTIFKALI